jgi:hypothetical protein
MRRRRENRIIEYSLFEPHPGASSATRVDDDAIRVADLDCGAVGEAVGLRQFHVCGEDKRTCKRAVRVLAILQLPE